MTEAEETLKEMNERLIRVETIVELINKSFNEAMPRINNLEKETERQKDSLKAAHNRLNDMDKRFYWQAGISISVIGGIIAKIWGT